MWFPAVRLRGVVYCSAEFYFRENMESVHSCAKKLRRRDRHNCLPEYLNSATRNHACDTPIRVSLPREN